MSGYKLEKMSLSDAEAVLDSTASVLEKAEKVAQELQLDIENLRANIAAENGILSEFEEESVIKSGAQSISDDAYFALRAAMNRLYQITRFPEQYADLHSVEKANERHYKEVVAPADGVEVYLDEKGIFVRTPMLASRNAVENGRPCKGKMSAPHIKCYYDSVFYAIKTAPNFSEYPFSSFQKKLVTCLFVFDNPSLSGNKFIDNDNHETKDVVDAITYFLPGGDAATSCNFFYSAAATDAILEGSYFVVTRPGEALKSEEIIAFWASKKVQEKSQKLQEK